MYIIADVGSNFKTKKDCLDSIYFASKTGANAVKFQLYNHKKLYGYAGKLEGELQKDWIKDLFEKAQACKVDFLCTPFDPGDIAVLSPYVKAWKIASSDINYVELLNACAKTEKPVFLSTGASLEDDISKAIACFPKSRVYLMYCISSYPSKEHDLNYIQYLYNKFKLPIGYSDHSIDIYQTPYTAKYIYNCQIFEKHFKITKMDTPDDPHSLDWHEFKRMVDRLKIKGPLAAWKINYSEYDMHQLYNRRLVATKDIEPGEILEYGVNYGAYRTKTRSGSYISPFDWQKINGLPAANKIGQGKSIAFYNIETPFG